MGGMEKRTERKDEERNHPCLLLIAVWKLNGNDHLQMGERNKKISNLD